ncbi:MAG: ABC transporter substrate-binding protein [Alphaproteobacteria bacterium]|nr:ABC transporter substrate-binding protein [Alphaproteobacteria bacterium]
MRSFIGIGTFFFLLAAHAASAAPLQAIAMHGEPKYGANFQHFDYVNPAAPKGGDVRLFALGTFDSLNSYILKGQAAAGLELTADTLMVEAADEPFTEYGLLAQSIEMAPDRSWVVFTLRPEARFNDGQPVTADDVVFSFDVLKTKGAPSFRLYYADVAKVEKEGNLRVRFTLSSGENRELPLILGQLPVLPKHYWQNRDFAQTTLEVPVSNGPYRIDKFEAGRFISYVRDPNYWGRDVPVRRGVFNFDHLRYDYYRDTTVALEAFKAAAYDFRQENVAKLWATGYDFPAVAAGLVRKEELHHQNPVGMQGFAFNLRRPLFRDRRVRQALGAAFDFEWANKNLFHGQYVRTDSYFANSELAAHGLPGPLELKILEPLRGRIPDSVFTSDFKPPHTDGSGNNRENLHQATEWLQEAGFRLKDGRLVDGTGQPFVFEILLSEPVWERIVMPFVHNLEKLGIRASVRIVDPAQYENRVRDFDFDMVVANWGESLSTGNEQREFWGSAAADMPGSRNLVGIKDPAIDLLTAGIIAASDRESLVAHTRALDRVLLSGYYVIPNWHIPYDRVAYWNKFGRPDVLPMKGYQFFDWWIDPAKAKELAGKKP